MPVAAEQGSLDVARLARANPMVMKRARLKVAMAFWSEDVRVFCTEPKTLGLSGGSVRQYGLATRAGLSGEIFE